LELSVFCILGLMVVQVAGTAHFLG